MEYRFSIPFMQAWHLNFLYLYITRFNIQEKLIWHQYSMIQLLGFNKYHFYWLIENDIISPKKDLIVNHNIFLITLVDHRIVLSIQQSRFNLVNNANEIISQGNYGSQSFYDQHRYRQKRNNNPTNFKVSYISHFYLILHSVKNPIIGKN